ncbi:MAG: hypothetical protein M1823_003194 [Watsoniomyces obsoletus]|nr:MAG: hypothetical protein M1823_003194 [Watsoniomyces obsoletus]
MANPPKGKDKGKSQGKGKKKRKGQEPDELRQKPIKFPDPLIDYYDVLGISVGETDPDVINAQYRSKVTEVHPDKVLKDASKSYKKKCETFVVSAAKLGGQGKPNFQEIFDPTKDKSPKDPRPHSEVYPKGYTPSASTVSSEHPTYDYEYTPKKPIGRPSRRPLAIERHSHAGEAQQGNNESARKARCRKIRRNNEFGYHPDFVAAEASSGPEPAAYMKVKLPLSPARRAVRNEFDHRWSKRSYEALREMTKEFRQEAAHLAQDLRDPGSHRQQGYDSGREKGPPGLAQDLVNDGMVISNAHCDTEALAMTVSKPDANQGDDVTDETGTACSRSDLNQGSRTMEEPDRERCRPAAGSVSGSGRAMIITASLRSWPYNDVQRCPCPTTMHRLMDSCLAGRSQLLMLWNYVRFSWMAAEDPPELFQDFETDDGDYVKIHYQLFREVKRSPGPSIYAIFHAGDSFLRDPEARHPNEGAEHYIAEFLREDDGGHQQDRLQPFRIFGPSFVNACLAMGDPPAPGPDCQCPPEREQERQEAVARELHWETVGMRVLQIPEAGIKRLVGGNHRGPATGLPLAPVGFTTVILKRRIVTPATSEAPPEYDPLELDAIPYHQGSTVPTLVDAIATQQPRVVRAIYSPSDKMTSWYINALWKLSRGIGSNVIAGGMADDFDYRAIQNILMGMMMPNEPIVDRYEDISPELLGQEGQWLQYRSFLSGLYVNPHI